MRALSAILTLTVLIGCGETPEPSLSQEPPDAITDSEAATEPGPLPEAPVTTDLKTYSFAPGEHGEQITIRSTFHAPADQTAFIVNCNGQIATGLQSKEGEEWVDVWDGLINQCLSEPIVVAPGGSHDYTIVVQPGSGAMSGRTDQLPSPGVYRVIWRGVLRSFDGSAYPFGEDLPEEQRVSAPFTIEP